MAIKLVINRGPLTLVTLCIFRVAVRTLFITSRCLIRPHRLSVGPSLNNPSACLTLVPRKFTIPLQPWKSVTTVNGRRRTTTGARRVTLSRSSRALFGLTRRGGISRVRRGPIFPTSHYDIARAPRDRSLIRAFEQPSARYRAKNSAPIPPIRFVASVLSRAKIARARATAFCMR